ncbi:thiamine pyrophosphate-dependent dehydrogenase E1 component subunit alpha [Mycetocola sp.]|uniref:thiamine pyrophosphate-dependent dehydrogenase E1 component subunit alpha n=1 Tax=Mycetocola sp. TaxID=1871042 RepID=UPI0026231D74|nr:thiamine pyrophosphate-dependent dehydrogenase E1 component subunit alpha [Mycetocola sp.]MCU1560711.1 pyruvate dehydrogenase (acetyl-transferring) component subunit alpha [Mycetocola sp.]
MAETDSTSPAPAVQVLAADGTVAPTASAEPYLEYLDRLTSEDHEQFYRDMVLARAFDAEAANLQRQGQLALWPPCHGQEGAQVGSGRAARAQDHIFPSYREHAVGLVRGVDLLGIIEVMRGTTHSGWDVSDPSNGNFRPYTLVIGAQALHAAGYAMGVSFDGATATGDPDTDQAVMVYFGDGATSQGDVNEAMIFAASYQTPQVFFLQNNHWAISVPVTTQSRTPLFQRGAGFGIPSVQVDGNDVLASYAVTAKHLDDARAGGGPQLIEALTYRIGAHTTSDDPTKYRTQELTDSWIARDPIVRFQAFLRNQGASDAFFQGVSTDAQDYAADVRRRTHAIADPEIGLMFDGVYSDEHPLMIEQKQWLEQYEAALDGSAS